MNVWNGGVGDVYLLYQKQITMNTVTTQQLISTIRVQIPDTYKCVVYPIYGPGAYCCPIEEVNIENDIYEEYATGKEARKMMREYNREQSVIC